jgi:glycosyltransferase involved in cell wall biosynthesis
VKLTVVTPRYGVDVVGGAELAMRLIAEHLVAQSDWVVEVLTTTALDADRWLPALPPGVTQENGVSVHRFPVTAGRSRDFDARSRAVLRKPLLVDESEQWAWIDAQGPLSVDLDEAVRSTDADVVAASPYLFPPVARAVLASRPPVLFHPAAHDEPPLRLPVFADVFAAASGFAFYTESERRVVQDHFGFVARRPQAVVGLGVDGGEGEAPAARAALGLGERPYVVVLGRVDENKGSTLAVELFSAYKRRRPGPLTLVFAGPVVHPPPVHPDVVVAGRIDEPTKWGLLRGAVALLSPSVYESFSFVVLEAWTAGIPAIVQASCAATREHAQASGAGLVFDGYLAFEVILDRVLGDRNLGSALAARGRLYVDGNFRWPVVIERYRRLVEAVAAGTR